MHVREGVKVLVRDSAPPRISTCSLRADLEPKPSWPRLADLEEDGPELEGRVEISPRTSMPK